MSLKLSSYLYVFTICILVPSFINTQEASNEIDPDYIECYWCNSRDIYCGKRVIDTMVTTVKCPRQSRCVVYTNPYDNYYLHRGCTYGMDLGEMEIKNGCFVEEEGSTYCFCDFNRCNAAGILDLRNLAEENNQTNDHTKFNKHEENNIEPFYLNDEIHTTAIHKKMFADNYLFITTTSKSTSTTTETTTTTTETTTTKLTSTISNEEKTIKLNDVLSDQYEQTNSRKLSGLENGNLMKKLQDFKSNLNLKSSEEIEKVEKISSKSYSPLDLFKQYKKLSTKVYTKQLVTRNATLPLTSTESIEKTIDQKFNNYPILYKLKVNDTISKNLLDNPLVKAKLGIKPNEKLSILIKRPLEDSKNMKQSLTLITNNIDNLNNFKDISFNYENNNRLNFMVPLAETEFTTSTSSWLSKLKAKLSHSISSSYQENKAKQNYFNFQYLIPTTTISPSTNNIELVDNNWSHVLTDNYKKKVGSVNFKCPKDGLFSHPTNCAQFLQCVDYGTYYERFYVQNCPAGLYFNQKLELCDYLENVNCLNL